MSKSDTELHTPSDDLLAQFSAIVGDQHAVRDPNDQAPYLTEWRDRYQGKTPVVLKPANTGQVSEILKLANQHQIGVVPQAGNTGLVGGQIPRPAGRDIVLSVERLNTIRSIDVTGKHMDVEAGVTLAAAQEHADQSGLAFPLRMASEGSACIGGAIATNAGGVHVLAHGTMRALTLGLEVVLANGDIWNGLQALKKDNTGYDLKDLIVGSEGTLGIVTAARVKLVAQPAGVATVMLGLDQLEDVATLFLHLSNQLGPELTAFEFMSDQTVAFVTEHMSDARYPFTKTCPWTILIDVSSQRDAEDAAQRLETALTDERLFPLLKDTAMATSQTQASDFWRLREAASEAQKIGGGSIKHDVSVPIEHIPAFIEKANALVTNLCPGARPCLFGHFGDGNIHYNVSQPEGGDRAAFLSQWEAMQAAVHDLVMQFNGSISAEHGIGIMKREALRHAKDAVALEAMRAIKMALDPNGILNPGKVL